jgi:hypothetical protein
VFVVKNRPSEDTCGACRSIAPREHSVDRQTTRKQGCQETERNKKMGRAIVGGFLVCSLAVVMLSTLAPTAPVGADEGSQIQRGFQIAPVPLDLKGKNRALVGLGSYIVNAQGGCNDCHTHPSYAPGGDPFLGQPKQVNAAQYLTGGRQFGPFTSRNLTPDPTTGLPADLTFDQFLEVMRKGIDFEQKHPQISPLLQVMPWPVYGDMTDRDLRAVYEYLSAIPSRPDNPNPGP